MSSFVPNPDFMPMLERAVMRELDEDVAPAIERDVKANLHPGAIGKHVSLTHRRARRESGNQVSVFVGYGRGLGPIFEGGTGQRSTKRGLNRGRIATANHAMRTARDNAVRRGLSLRYL